MVSSSGKPKVLDPKAKIKSNQLPPGNDSESRNLSEGADTERYTGQENVRLIVRQPEPVDDDDVEADHEAELC